MRFRTRLAWSVAVWWALSACPVQAATFTVFIRTLTTPASGSTQGTTYMPIITDQRVARKGLLRSPGVITVQKAQAGTTSTYYAWDDGVARDVDFPYAILSTDAFQTTASKSAVFPALYATPREQAIDGFYTVGVANSQMRNSTVTASVRAWYTGAPIGSAQVRCEIYHVDGDLVETLITSFTKTITSTETTYTQALTFSTTWGTNDRLLIKYVARDTGL